MNRIQRRVVLISGVVLAFVFFLGYFAVPLALSDGLNHRERLQETNIGLGLAAPVIVLEACFYFLARDRGNPKTGK